MEEKILELIRSGVPPECWYDPNEITKEDILRVVKEYLDYPEELTRDEKIDRIHLGLTAIGLSYEDIGVTAEDKKRIFREPNKRYTRGLLRETIELTESPSQFRLKWAPISRRVEAIRWCVKEFGITLEDIGTTEENLSQLEQWQPT